VLAQKLIFGHSDHGDLTPFLSAYFDTTTGAKREAESYRRIASALGALASAGLFVSDVVAELDAAREAGLATALAVSPTSGPSAPFHLGFDDLA
jgi:enolase-phosphatase E1